MSISDGPGVYPRSRPRESRSEAEIRVYKALSAPGGLPEGAYVWHSVSFRDDRRDYEIDFLYAHPQQGVIALEVKGGQIVFKDGLAHQNGRVIQGNDPLAQVESAMYALAMHYKRRYKKSLPAFASAVWFPDMGEPISIPKSDYEGRTLGHQSVSYSSEALSSLADRILRKDCAPRDTSFIQHLHQIFGLSSAEKPVQLGARFLQHRLERARLDDVQRAILEGLSENKRCVVKGAAGTGKSQLARLKAFEFAEEGKNVLFTCFTEGLARDLAEACARYPNITVKTLRALARDLAIEARKASAEPRNAKEWDAITMAGVEALEENGSPFDALIVDEAQDFGENDWLFLLAAGGDEKPLWLFLDDAQRFWADRVLPDWVKSGSASFTLKQQYRVPTPLLQLAQAFYLTSGSERDAAIAEAREIAQIEDRLKIIVRQDTMRELERELRRAIEHEQVLPSDIAILSLRGQGAENIIASVDRIGNFEVVRVSDEAASESIVADTFLRFKGLERPLIFILDLEDVSDRRDERLHIAMTRALGSVVIITNEEAARENGFK